MDPYDWSSDGSKCFHAVQCSSSVPLMDMFKGVMNSKSTSVKFQCELLSPAVEKTVNLPHTFHSQFYFIDFGISDCDNERGLWIQDKKSMRFRICSCSDERDEQVLQQLFKNLGDNCDLDEKALDGQPLRSMVSAALLNSNGNLLKNILEISPSSWYTLTGTLISGTSFPHLPVKMRIISSLISLDTDNMFWVQDYFGVWYKLSRYSKQYKPIATKCYSDTLTKIESHYNWPVDTPGEQLRRLTNCSMINQNGALTSMDEITRKRDDKFMVFGDVIPTHKTDPSLLSIPICVQPVNYSIDFGTDPQKTNKGLWIETEHNIWYKIEPPYHHTYSKIGINLQHKAEKFLLFYETLKLWCVLPAPDSRLECDDTIEELQEKSNGAFDVHFIANNAKFIESHIRSVINTQKSGGLLRSLHLQKLTPGFENQPQKRYKRSKYTNPNTSFLYKEESSNDEPVKISSIEKKPATTCSHSATKADIDLSTVTEIIDQVHQVGADGDKELVSDILMQMDNNYKDSIKTRKQTSECKDDSKTKRTEAAPVGNRPLSKLAGKDIHRPAKFERTTEKVLEPTVKSDYVTLPRIKESSATPFRSEAQVIEQLESLSSFHDACDVTFNKTESQAPTGSRNFEEESIEKDDSKLPQPPLSAVEHDTQAERVQKFLTSTKVDQLVHLSKKYINTLTLDPMSSVHLSSVKPTLEDIVQSIAADNASNQLPTDKSKLVLKDEQTIQKKEKPRNSTMTNRVAKIRSALNAGATATNKTPVEEFQIWTRAVEDSICALQTECQDDFMNTLINDVALSFTASQVTIQQTLENDSNGFVAHSLRVGRAIASFVFNTETTNYTEAALCENCKAFTKLRSCQNNAHISNCNLLGQLKLFKCEVAFINENTTPAYIENSDFNSDYSTELPQSQSMDDNMVDQSYATTHPAPIILAQHLPTFNEYLEDDQNDDYFNVNLCYYCMSLNKKSDCQNCVHVDGFECQPPCI